MFGLRLYRVRGQSMRPTLKPGDVLVLRKRAPREEDIVVVDHPRLGVIVKRLDKDGQLSGDDPESTPADRLGRWSETRHIGTLWFKISA